ncbi:hypothetical protein DFJ73DRAFT_191192 [Zopfochytrium polystomum]|nr:hypothetical protein DFJ73DRAFT_191192 [Zopfochytrium polystomum]
MNNIKAIAKLNERELERNLTDNASWHDQYKDSAYVYVGGLPYNLTEGDIIVVFSQWGEVVDINLVRDKKTGKSLGYAFLAYEDQRSTVLAVDNFNGITLVGRTIRVDHVSQYRGERVRDDETEEDRTRRMEKERLKRISVVPRHLLDPEERRLRDEMDRQRQREGGGGGAKSDDDPSSSDSEDESVDEEERRRRELEAEDPMRDYFANLAKEEGVSESARTSKKKETKVKKEKRGKKDKKEKRDQKSSKHGRSASAADSDYAGEGRHSKRQRVEDSAAESESKTRGLPQKTSQHVPEEYDRRHFHDRRNSDARTGRGGGIREKERGREHEREREKERERAPERERDVRDRYDGKEEKNSREEDRSGSIEREGDRERDRDRRREGDREHHRDGRLFNRDDRGRSGGRYSNTDNAQRSRARN